MYIDPIEFEVSKYGRTLKVLGDEPSKTSLLEPKLFKMHQLLGPPILVLIFNILHLGRSSKKQLQETGLNINKSKLKGIKIMSNKIHIVQCKTGACHSALYSS